MPELQAGAGGTSGRLDLFRDLEMPLVPVLADMEMEGVALDVDFLRQMSAELSERLAADRKPDLRSGWRAFQPEFAPAALLSSVRAPED